MLLLSAAEEASLPSFSLRLPVNDLLRIAPAPCRIVVFRLCGDGTAAAAIEYEGEDAFACEAAAAAEEGASKLALGAAAVVAALYMA